ncbi:MAG: DMT family transporter [Candidatus Hodarchaeales archaeon]|jgi:transporter family protein
MDENIVFGIILALLTAIVSALASLFDRKGLETHDPLAGTLIRGSFAIPFLLVATLLFSDLTTLDNLTMIFWIILIVSAILMCVGDLIYMFVLEFAPISHVIPLAAAYPIFVTTFAIILLNEQPSLLTLIGTFCVIAGVSFVAGNIVHCDNENHLSGRVRKGSGLLALIAAAIWGLAIILVGLVFKETNVEIFPIVLFRLSIVLVILAVFSAIQKRSHLTRLNKRFRLDRGTYFLGLAGIMFFVIGQATFYTSIKMIGASQAVPLSSISPMIATILGIIFLNERVSLKQLFGICLIIAGSTLIVL